MLLHHLGRGFRTRSILIFQPVLCHAHHASPATLHLTDPGYSACGKLNQGDLCCGRSQRLNSGPV